MLSTMKYTIESCIIYDYFLVYCEFKSGVASKLLLQSTVYLNLSVQLNIMLLEDAKLASLTEYFDWNTIITGL